MKGEWEENSESEGDGDGDDDDDGLRVVGTGISGGR